MTRFLRIREAVSLIDLVTGPSFSSLICKVENNLMPIVIKEEYQNSWDRNIN